jgi:hypothetical protein
MAGQPYDILPPIDQWLSEIQRDAPAAKEKLSRAYEACAASADRAHVSCEKG